MTPFSSTIWDIPNSPVGISVKAHIPPFLKLWVQRIGQGMVSKYIIKMLAKTLFENRIF